LQYLKNKHIAITRKSEDAREFSRLVELSGGVALALPTIDIIPRNSSVIFDLLNLLDCRADDYCLFMSSQSVNIVLDQAKKIGKTDSLINALNSKIIVAVGPKTSRQLTDNGIDVKIVPSRYSSIGIIDFFSRNAVNKGRRIIIPRSGASNEFVSKALTDIGMVVNELHLYDIKTSAPNKTWQEFIPLLISNRIDSIVFTSASTVRSFFEIASTLLLPIVPIDVLLNKIKAIISIGPFTTSELQKMNVMCYEAEEHTAKGTFEKLSGLLQC